MAVAGLVAAAGRSARMGRPKALLPFVEVRSNPAPGAQPMVVDELADGPASTFVGELVARFSEAGLAPLYVTLPEPPDGERVLAALRSVPADVVTIANGWPDLGLGGSVRTVVRDLQRREAEGTRCEGLVVVPVDCPFVGSALPSELAGYVAEGAPAAVVVVGEERAHPVAFGRQAFRALDRAAEARGMRTVLEALGDTVIEASSDDERLLVDLNDPDAYERTFGRALGKAPV